MLFASVSLSLFVVLSPSCCSLLAPYDGSSLSTAQPSARSCQSSRLFQRRCAYPCSPAELVMVVHHEPVEGMEVQEYLQKKGKGTPIIKYGRLSTAPKEPQASFRRNMKEDAADVATQVREHHKFAETLAEFRAAGEPSGDGVEAGLFGEQRFAVGDGEVLKLGPVLDGDRERRPPAPQHSPSKGWTKRDLNRLGAAKRQPGDATECKRPDCVATRHKLEESERENKELRAELEAQTTRLDSKPRLSDSKPSLRLQAPLRSQAARRGCRESRRV